MGSLTPYSRAAVRDYTLRGYTLRGYSLRGYTLVELLVVVAIIGVFVSVTALAWRTDPARMLESEARRLAAQLELAQARSRVGGGRLAFSASEGSYLFWQRDASGLWREIETSAGPSGLSGRELSAPIRIESIHLAGVALSLGARVAMAADDDVALAITLGGPGGHAIVASGTFSGRMEVRMLPNEK